MADTRQDSGLFTIPEFQKRGVIKQAPDVLVYVNGIKGARWIAPVSSKEQSVEYMDGITSVNVQNNLDAPGTSTANIDIMTPIYDEHSNYWIQYEHPDISKYTVREPYFAPMMEIKIYMKGRFMVGMRPRYYPVFWGFIQNIEENYSGGMWKISLQCADMLKWWEFMQINVHPIPASNIAYGGGQKITAYGTIFEQANPFTIMYTLVRDMYTQELGPQKFVVPTWLGQITPPKSRFFSTDFKDLSKGIMSYWRQRFNEVGNILKMYGLSGAQLDSTGDPKNTVQEVLEDEYNKFDLDRKKPEDNKRRTSNSDKQSASTPRNWQDFGADEYLRNFTVFFDFQKMGKFDDAEYMTKLEIATEVKNRVDFEFFQDVNGNFIFKPPFYNANTKYIQPYRINPSDIINSSFSVNAEAVVTTLEIQTPQHDQLRYTPFGRGVGFYMDIKLAQEYGIRFKRKNLEYINKKSMANQLAAGFLSFMNAGATTGSVTIPGRPELRLGYPIYMTHRDSFHYVKSINHAFDFGGSFTTTLSFEAERRRIYNHTNEGWSEPLKNQVYIKKRDLVVSKEELEARKKKQEEKLKQVSEKKLKCNPEIPYSGNLPSDTNTEVKRKLQKSTGRLDQLMDEGLYDLKEIREAAKELKKEPAESLSVVTKKTVPFTDDEGYKVIGAFLYGRGVDLGNDPAMLDGRRALSNTIESNRSKDSIVRMKTGVGSQKESESMDEYFTAVSNEGGKITKEGLIPAFIDSFNINLDSTSTLDKTVNPCADDPANTSTANQLNKGNSSNNERSSKKLIDEVKK